MAKKWNTSAARRATLDLNAKIKPGPNAPEFKNPKRGKSATRFAFYPKAGTVGEYGKKWGKVGLCDICWDLDHGFIVLESAPVKK
jgi:hypothetical protein